MKALIEKTKKLRNFQAQAVLDRKLEAINSFFSYNNLDSCVIGISGGIDSAVAYKLMVEAAKQPNSPLKMIVALLMPITSPGTSNQGRATEQGLKVVESHPFTKHYICELGGAFQTYIGCLEGQLDINALSPWAIGQAASVLRTPNNYFHAAILQQQGYHSVVVGTINRDEGAYLGFFGKASDAMVDLQPIGDLHKSEVYALAELLGVHKDIIDATPAGDVWDEKVDEEMIGAPYWFVEMYMLCKEFTIIDYNLTDPQDIADFAKYSYAIEHVHKKNVHKYRVGMPSHFVDVINRKIPGGW
jgi:NAD+ synthetase